MRDQTIIAQVTILDFSISITLLESPTANSLLTNRLQTNYCLITNQLLPDYKPITA